MTPHFDAVVVVTFALAWSWLLSVLAVECKREIDRIIRGWRVRRYMKQQQEQIREVFSELR